MEGNDLFHISISPGSPPFLGFPGFRPGGIAAGWLFDKFRKSYLAAQDTIAWLVVEPPI